MARVCASLALLGLLVATSFGQAFGRFGYTQSPSLAGFTVDATGIRPNADTADRIRFASRSARWQPLSTTPARQVVALSGGVRMPSKLRLDLLAAGPEAFFESGLRLDLSATGSPYLTWEEGSVGPNVPTPLVRWILLSYRDNQPPVLLVFPDEPISLVLRGRPGQWNLLSEKPFRGWVRFVLPLGIRSQATATAAALGSLVEAVRPLIAPLSAPTPTVSGPQLEGDREGVTATWSFSGPGAFLPPPVLLAKAGGYPLRVLSGVQELPIDIEEGPRVVATENRLVVRFPVRRVPTGRGLALGAAELPAPGTVSPFDVPSVADLALQNLLAFREPAYAKLAEDTLAQFLTEADYIAEPATGQQHPFLADGTGIDLAAAHALLMQALAISVKADSDENSLLTSLTWRRDAHTWRLPISDDSRARRASALAAIAGALCPEVERRFDAALFEAGLAAQRGLDLRRERRGVPRPIRIEPLEGIRAAIFGTAPGRVDAFAPALFGDIRVYGQQPLIAESVGKDAIRLRWQSARPGSFTLASAYPLVAGDHNLKSLSTSSAAGFFQVRFAPGATEACELIVKIPSWAAPIPRLAIPAAYTETAR